MARFYKAEVFLESLYYVGQGIIRFKFGQAAETFTRMWRHQESYAENRELSAIDDALTFRESMELKSFLEDPKNPITRETHPKGILRLARAKAWLSENEIVGGDHNNISKTDKEIIKGVSSASDTFEDAFGSPIAQHGSRPHKSVIETAKSLAKAATLAELKMKNPSLLEKPTTEELQALELLEALRTADIVPDIRFMGEFKITPEHEEKAAKRVEQIRDVCAPHMDLIEKHLDKATSANVANVVNKAERIGKDQMTM